MENRAFSVPKDTLFLLILVQPGEGCDYTIGCGVKVEPLKARTIEDARKEAKEYFMGVDEFGDCTNRYYVDPKSEAALSHAILVTAHEYLPLDAWRRDLVNLRLANEATEKEARERAELERLKAKYGSKT